MLTIELLGILVTAGFFAIRYGVTRPWWRSLTGRALLVSAVGLTLLAATFLAQAFASIPDLVFVVVAGVIWLGAIFKTALLVTDDVRHRRPAWVWRLVARLQR